MELFGDKDSVYSQFINFPSKKKKNSRGLRSWLRLRGMKEEWQPNAARDSRFNLCLGKQTAINYMIGAIGKLVQLTILDYSLVDNILSVSNVLNLIIMLKNVFGFRKHTLMNLGVKGASCLQPTFKWSIKRKWNNVNKLQIWAKSIWEFLIVFLRFLFRVWDGTNRVLKTWN